MNRASRPKITDEVATGIKFVRTCVLDQRSASHNRGDHSWDKRYAAALAALDHIVNGYERAFAINRTSRLKITDEVVAGLRFAQACVLDQRSASHNRADYSWDKRYAAALAALDHIVNGHERSTKKSGR